MLTILANALLTATRRVTPAPRRAPATGNPLSRVRTGGLTLAPRKRA